MAMERVENTLKFSESGVRGVVGEGLTPRLVADLAAAFGTYVGRGRVVVGRDTRPTGEMFEMAVVAGLQSVGCEVVRLGIVPTPTVQLMVLDRDAAGGIAITASHNPPEWNALKFIGFKGMFLDPSAAAELFDLFSRGAFECRRETELGAVRRFEGAFARHRDRIFREIDVDAIRAKRFRVAVDCVNGVGAVHTPDFLSSLGCEVIKLNAVPNGKFGRTPEPVPEALGELARVVREYECAIGFAHDPDGDRLTLVADGGRVLSPQLTVALAAEHLLETDPGPVVVNLQTTGLVEGVAKSYGCPTVYAKVGEINVVEKMIECNSHLGGEGNCGGVIWRKIHPGRDSYAAMALMLELLAVAGAPLSEIVDGLPPMKNRSRKYPCSPLRARDVLAALAEKYAELHPLTFDGIRINLADGWVLFRMSNTEPVLRLYVESGSEARTVELYEKFSAELEKLLV